MIYLKEWMIEKNMTAKELAKKSGVLIRQINKYTTREIEPRPATQSKLSSALGIRVKDLKILPCDAEVKASETKNNYTVRLDNDAHTQLLVKILTEHDVECFAETCNDSWIVHYSHTHELSIEDIVSLLDLDDNTSCNYTEKDDKTYDKVFEDTMNSSISDIVLMMNNVIHKLAIEHASLNKQEYMNNMMLSKEVATQLEADIWSDVGKCLSRVIVDNVDKAQSLYVQSYLDRVLETHQVTISDNFENIKDIINTYYGLYNADSKYKQKMTKHALMIHSDTEKFKKVCKYLRKNNIGFYFSKISNSDIIITYFNNDKCIDNAFDKLFREDDPSNSAILSKISKSIAKTGIINFITPFLKWTPFNVMVGSPKHLKRLVEYLVEHNIRFSTEIIFENIIIVEYVTAKPLTNEELREIYKKK